MKVTRALVALACLAAASPASAEDRSCAAARIDGSDARYWHEGVWAPLAEGPLPAGETIVETGPATRVEIACNDGVVVTVGVSTTVNLDSLVGPAGPSRNVVLQLLEGIVGVVAPSRNWARFDLRAPLAIASIRSTEWLGSYAPGAPSAFYVREGAVEVRAMDGSVRRRLGRDQGIDVSDDGASPVRIWSEERIAAAGARLGFGWR